MTLQLFVGLYLGHIGVCMPICPLRDDGHGVTLTEFQSMSDDVRRDLLVSAFEERIERLHNFRYVARQRTRTCRVADGKVVEDVWLGILSEYRRSRIGDSYRLDTTVFGDDFSGSKSLQQVQSSFNSVDGIAINAVHRADGRVFGRIDTQHDQIVVDDRYSYWLTGPEVTAAEFMFPYLLSQKQEWRISVEGDGSQVKLEAPWSPFHSREKPLGWRRIWMDITKGFMPVKGEAKWEESVESWRTEAFTVSKSVNVAGVWMPTELREIVDSSSGGEEFRGVASVYEISIDTIEIGEVNGSDLKVAFPPGTEVVNILDGVTYFTSTAGNRINEQPLFVGNRFVTEAPQPVPMKNRWLWGLNIVAAFIAAVWFARRRRPKK